MKLVGLFTKAGASSIDDQQELRSIRLMNALAYFFALSALSFILIFTILGAPYLSVYLLALAILFSIVPLLNSQKKDQIARPFLIFCLYLGIAFFHIILGKSTYIFLVLIPILCVPFAISSRADAPLNYLALTLSVVLFMLFGYTDYFEHLVVDNSLKDIKYPFTVFMMFIPFYVLRTLRKEQSEYIERLQKSLNERELLIKEVHHRVKNNFQIINSLIKFEISETTRKGELKALESTNNRIHTMAYVHNMLYVNQKLSEVNCNEFISGLIRINKRIYGERLNVKYTNNLVGHLMQVESAMPIGLMVCEAISLLTNMAPKSSPTVVKIQVDHSDEQQLSIKIWNPFGKEEKMRKQKNVGYMLIEQLVGQAEGSYNLSNENGLTFEFGIPG